jgi:hypothetical protein
MWHTLCDTHYVAHTMWHTLCGTHYVTHTMWHTLCGTHYVAHTMWHTLCSQFYRNVPKNWLDLERQGQPTSLIFVLHHVKYADLNKRKGPLEHRFIFHVQCLITLQLPPRPLRSAWESNVIVCVQTPVLDGVTQNCLSKLTLGCVRQSSGCIQICKNGM